MTSQHLELVDDLIVAAEVVLAEVDKLGAVC